MGIDTIAFDPGANEPDFSLLGFAPLAAELNVDVQPTPIQTPTSVYLVLHMPKPGDPPPCQRLNDGNGVYAVAGQLTGFDPALLRDPNDPRRSYAFVCPGRPAIFWPAAS